MEKKAATIRVAACSFIEGSLTDFNFLVCRFFPRNDRQAYLQYTVLILCGNVGKINALIQVETPFKPTATVLSLYPVETRKSFRWRVRNGKFSALYTQIEIFFNSAWCKYQHFETVVCFVDVHSGSLRRTD